MIKRIGMFIILSLLISMGCKKQTGVQQEEKRAVAQTEEERIAEEAEKERVAAEKAERKKIEEARIDALLERYKFVDEFRREGGVDFESLDKAAFAGVLKRSEENFIHMQRKSFMDFHVNQFAITSKNKYDTRKSSINNLSDHIGANGWVFELRNNDYLAEFRYHFSLSVPESFNREQGGVFQYFIIYPRCGSEPAESLNYGRLKKVTIVAWSKIQNGVIPDVYVGAKKVDQYTLGYVYSIELPDEDKYYSFLIDSMELYNDINDLNYDFYVEEIYPGKNKDLICIGEIYWRR